MPSASPTTNAPSTAPTAAPTYELGQIVDYAQSANTSEYPYDAEGVRSAARLLTVDVDAAQRTASDATLKVSCTVPKGSKAALALVDASPIEVTKDGVRGARAAHFEVYGVWDASNLGASRSATVECEVSSTDAAQATAPLQIPVTVDGVAQPSLRLFCSNATAANLTTACSQR